MSGKPQKSSQASLSEQFAAHGIRLRGDPARPVFKGDVVATVSPDVLPSLVLAISEKHFHVDRTTGEIAAKGYGLLDIADNEMRIRPQLKIVDERSAIRAVVHASDFVGRPMTPSRMAEVLLRMGVCAEPALEDIRRALEQARETGRPVRDVIIAKGVPPEQGSDGSYEIFTPEMTEAKANEDVDHRGRSNFRTVKEGEVIGRIVPPVPGKGGVDIFGNVLPCKESHPAAVKTGPGVAISPDGLSILATSTGLLSCEGPMLQVVEGLEIKGDVDFTTGNVILESGNVVIQASVQNGFTVDVPGNVAVADSINAAFVRAGGDILVGRGILTTETGDVTAGGTISALFAENSRITASGDVIVTHNITNCQVGTGGKVICIRGKGVILGGEISAVRGIEAREIGSEFGVKTLITMGPRLLSVDREEAQRKKADVKATLFKIEAAIGQGELRAILERTPPADRQRVAQLLKIRIAAETQLAEVESMLSQEREAAIQCGQIKLRVKGPIHPGVSVTILGRILEVTETLSFATVGFDPETMQIVVS